MKTKMFFYLMVAVILISCTPKSDKLPQGEWKLVKCQYFNGDSLLGVLSDKEQFNQVKIWTENYFMFVGRYKSDTTFNDYYGYGTYTLEGNKYEEQITFHRDPELMGQKLRCFMVLKNDTLFQTFPVDENWEIEKNYAIEQYVLLK
jgi:hypothetical protein